MRYIRVDVPTDVSGDAAVSHLVVDTEAYPVPAAIARVPVGSIQTVIDALNA